MNGGSSGAAWLRALMAGVSVLAVMSAAKAQTAYNWTGGSTTGNPVGNTWGTAANWDIGTIPATNSDVVLPTSAFSGPYTVSVDPSATAVLDSVTINNNATLDVGANTFNVNGSPSGAISIASAGSLTLEGGALNATSISNAGTLGGYGTISAAISGAGTIVVSNGGTLTVPQQNFTAGQFQLNGGTLASAGITLGSGASLSGYGTVTANLSGSGTVTASGGTLTLSGTVGVEVFVGASGTLDIPGVEILTQSTTDVLGTIGSDLVLAGNSLIVESTGTVTSGASILSGGTLDLYGGGSVSAQLDPGSMLVLDTNANISSGDGGRTFNVLSGGNSVGTLTNSGAAVNITGAGAELDFTGSNTFDNATITLENSGSASVNAKGVSSVLTLGAHASIVQSSGSAVLGGSGGIINNGSIESFSNGGTLTIAPASFTVGTNGYILAAGGATVAINPGNFTNLSGGTLAGGIYDVGPNSTIQIDSGTVTQIGANALVILEGSGASFKSTGGDIGQTLTTIGSGTLTIGADASPTFANNVAVMGLLEAGGDSTFSGGIAVDGVVFFEPDAGETVTVSGPLSGGAVTIGHNGTSGTVIFSGANSGFLGGTNVTSGQLDISQPVNLGSGPVNITGGTLDIGGLTLFDGSLGGHLTLDGGTIQNGTLSTTGDFGTGSGSGFTLQTGDVRTILAGTGSLTVQSNGNLILANGALGPNTYSGATTINPGGTLQIGDSTDPGNVPGALADGGTLILYNAVSPFSNAISGSGEVVVTGNINLTGNNTYTGDTIISTGNQGNPGTGTLSINSSGALGTNNRVIVNNGGALIVQSGGVVSGNSSNPTYPGTNSLTVNYGGTLDLFGGGVADSATLNSGSNLILDDAALIQATNNGATFVVMNTGTAAGTINNGGATINVTGASAELDFIGNNDFNNATINIGNATSAAVIAARDSGPNPGVLTFDTNAIINHTTGFATLTSDTNGGESITNNGTINASAPAGQLQITPYNFTNNGTIKVTNGDTVTIQPLNSFTDFNAGDLSGGIYDIGANSQIVLSGQVVTQLDAKVILEDSGATLNDGSGHDISLTVATIGPNGALYVQGGASPSFGNLTDEGILQLGGNGTQVGAIFDRRQPQPRSRRQCRVHQRPHHGPGGQRHRHRCRTGDYQWRRQRHIFCR